TGLLALTAYAWQQHTQRETAVARHADERNRWENELRASNERREQAERKLKEVPANILLELQAVIEPHSAIALTAQLSEYAEYVGRMIQFTEVQPKPVALRTFAKRGGDLYVVGKLGPQAQDLLREDAAFILEFKDANALVTPSALLRVHQFER